MTGLALIVFALAALQAPCRPVGENGRYQAYMASRELSDKDFRQVVEAARKAGYQKIPNVALDRLGLLVWDTAGASKEIQPAIARTKGLDPVPVKVIGGQLVIPSGRYIVSFADEVNADEAIRLLKQAQFEILDAPGPSSSWFVVKRPSRATAFSDNVNDLKKLPGVEMAVMDSLNIEIRK